MKVNSRIPNIIMANQLCQGLVIYESIYHHPAAAPNPNTFTQAKYEVNNIIQAAPLRQLA